MSTGLPFDDFRRLLRDLPPIDHAAAEAARSGLMRSGQVASLAAWLSGASGKAPVVNRPQIALFAATHGVVARGVSTLPVWTTAAQVEACGAGTAAVNAICAAHQYGLKVYDLALHMPTGDIAAEGAMDERTCAATIAFGLEAVAGGIDLLLVGTLASAGGETVAAAVLAALHGGGALDWLPDDEDDVTQRRVETIDAALGLHAAARSDPLTVLRCLGGRDMAAVAGAIIAARVEKVPTVLDGVTALAAAAVLAKAQPSALDHCSVAGSTTLAMDRLAVQLGLHTLLAGTWLDADGVASAMAAGVLRDVANIHASRVAQERAGRSGRA